MDFKAILGGSSSRYVCIPVSPINLSDFIAYARVWFLAGYYSYFKLKRTCYRSPVYRFK